MPIDFFKAGCRTDTSEPKFGICDDDNEYPAYINTDISDESIWIATVLNPNSKVVTFIAIDKCIDFPLINGNMKSRCDVALTCDNYLYIIELKDKRSDWLSSGMEQLEATIQTLKADLGKTYENYTLRKAYVANRRHPSFHVIKNETMQKFWAEYRVRLDIQATIKMY